MLLEAVYTCPHCAQHSDTTVDPSQGDTQSYVEDCRVCCHPLVLRVWIRKGEASIDASPEVE